MVVSSTYNQKREKEWEKNWVDSREEILNWSSWRKEKEKGKKFKYNLNKIKFK